MTSTPRIAGSKRHWPLWLLLCLAGPALGQESNGLFLASLHSDTQLSLVDAVVAANERVRLEDWAAQREQLTASRRAMGDSWLGDAPSVGGLWRDYQWLEDQNLYEAEVYLALPLWRPGERKALRELAQEDESLAHLQQQSRALANAGRVRQALWQWRDADSEVELLQQLLAGAERYADQMAVRFEAGDVARTEYLQARQQALDWRSRLLDAEAKRIDSTRQWRLITGLSSVPAEAVEPRAAVVEIDQEHPLLQLGLAEVRVLKAELEATRQGGSKRPSVSLNLKREVFEEQLPSIDSVGVGVQIPLGRGKATAVTASGQSQRLLEAEIELQNLRRKLDEDLHEVRHQMHINDSNLADSRELLAIAEQVYQMQKLANEQGEITVIEVLRAGQEVAKAQKRFTLLNLERDALVARYNQVVGVMPQ